MRQPPTYPTPPRHGAARTRNTSTTLLRALAGLVALLALLAGLPTVLWWGTRIVAPPGIAALGNLLTTQDSGQVFLLALAIAAWTGWILFALSVLLEIPAQLRGRTAPRLRLLIGQRTASTLVGAVLLALPTSTTLVSLAPAHAAAAPHHPRPTSRHAAQPRPQATDAQGTEGEAGDQATMDYALYTVREVRPAESLWSIADQQLGDGNRWEDIARLNHGRTMSDGTQFDPGGLIRPGWTLHLPPDAKHPTSDTRLESPTQTPSPQHPATYTVRPGDTLWDIARIHLGNAQRWPEIYQLNCDRTQPDGHHLHDPDQLSPGWILHLPLTEQIPPAQTGQAAPTTHPQTTTPPHQPAPATPPPAALPTPRQPTPPPATHRHQATQALHQAAQQRPVSIGIGIASLIGVTTAAGIAAAVAFARRHASRWREPSLETLGQEPPRLPEAVAIAHQAHLTTRAARSDAWQDLPRRPAPAEPRRPGTVTVAQYDGQELLLDALAVEGGLTLTGPGAASAARALVIAIASAAQRLRPASPAVRLISPADTMARLLPGSNSFCPAWTITDSPHEALDAAEHALLEQARHAQHRADADGTPLSSQPPMTVLLLDEQPTDQRHLSSLAARSTPGHLAVITLHSSSALWHLHIAADGTTTGDLDTFTPATMFTLAPEAAHELLTTLYAAHGRELKLPPHPPKPAESAPRPTTATAEENNPTERPGKEHDPAPSSQRRSARERNAAREAALQNAAPNRPVHIRLFGGFTLTVRGEESHLVDALKDGTREFIALLAAYPHGLRGEEINEKMSLSDDPEDAGRELGNLRRATRRLLRTATGQKEPAFLTVTGDRHRLDPQLVATDVAAFTDALQEATAADTPYARADALSRAVAVYDGPLCDGADYLWVSDLRQALHRRAIDALMLLADHMTQHSADPEPALALLNEAADFDPTNERIYRRIISLQRALGREDAAHHTLTLLTHRLAEIEAEPEAATLALLQDAPEPIAPR